MMMSNYLLCFQDSLEQLELAGIDKIGLNLESESDEMLKDITKHGLNCWSYGCPWSGVNDINSLDQDQHSVISFYL